MTLTARQYRAYAQAEVAAANAEQRLIVWRAVERLMRRPARLRRIAK